MVTPERIEGLLIGTAVGDAYGLPFEGMSARAIARRWPNTEPRYRLLGRIGFVSDDTEQAVLILEALLRGGGELDRTVTLFRRSMVAWFWRLPWGIGLSTLKACLLISLGVRNSGRPSAGNGSAMRAAPLAVFFPDDVDARHRFGESLARTTHTDPRAIDGARFVADLAAACLGSHSRADRRALVESALAEVREPRVRAAIEAGIDASADPDVRAALPSTGFVVHTLTCAVAFFAAPSATPFAALDACARHGGDTDTIGAILGGWLGALSGPDAFPPVLVETLEVGPFGREQLRALARAAASGARVPRRSWLRSLVRKLSLYPVVIAHGLRRLLP